MPESPRPSALPTTDLPADVHRALDEFRVAWGRRAPNDPPLDPDAWAVGLVGVDRELFAREAAVLAAQLAGRETVDQPTANDPAQETRTFGTDGFEAHSTVPDESDRERPV